MNHPGRGSTTSFHRRDGIRRGNANDSANGAAFGPRYWRGAQIHANPRRRLNAVWLFELRIELGPADCTTSTARRHRLAVTGSS